MDPEEVEAKQIDWKGNDISFELGVGEEFYCAFHRHGSVGEDAEFEIGDESVISFLREEAEYLHPERMKPGWTGGDSEGGRWYFKGIGIGNTTLKISVIFRGDIESEHQVRIKVI